MQFLSRYFVERYLSRDFYQEVLNRLELLELFKLTQAFTVCRQSRSSLPIGRVRRLGIFLP